MMKKSHNGIKVFMELTYRYDIYGELITRELEINEIEENEIPYLNKKDIKNLQVDIYNKVMKKHEAVD
jgi:hypothetical protein